MKRHDADEANDFQVVRDLAHAKLRRDFQNSHLHSPSGIEADKKANLKALKAACIFRESLGLLYPRPLQINQLAHTGLTSEEGVRLLRRHGQVNVMTTCIASAAISVARSMASRNKIKTELSIQFDKVTGRDQMRSLAQNGPTPDFIISPDQAFFLSNNDVSSQYRMLTPCFYEDQYLLRRIGVRENRGGKVYACPDSSGEAMIRAWRTDHRIKGRKPVYREAVDFSLLALSVEPPDLLAVWEPMASGLIQQAAENHSHDPSAPLLERVDKSWYPVMHSLFVHERLTKPDSLALVNAFEEVFIAEWNYCRALPAYAWSLLESNRDFLQYFAAGAGCVVPHLFPSELDDVRSGGANLSSLSMTLLPDVFVSYAWGEDTTKAGREREEIVDHLCEAVRRAGRTIGRDKERIQPGGSIEKFAQEIARAKRVVAVISDKSLRSKYCMVLELFGLWRRCDYVRKEFQEKLIALVMDDAVPLLTDEAQLIRHWRDELAKEQALLEPDQRSTDRLSYLNRLDDFCGQLPAILAAIKDTVMKRGFREIMEDQFSEVILRLPS